MFGSESFACPEGHYDSQLLEMIVTDSFTSESFACPEGHYDPGFVESVALLVHRNPSPARKGITTPNNNRSTVAINDIGILRLPGRALRLSVTTMFLLEWAQHDRNPSPARKGITTKHTVR